MKRPSARYVSIIPLLCVSLSSRPASGLVAIRPSTVITREVASRWHKQRRRRWALRSSEDDDDGDDGDMIILEPTAAEVEMEYQQQRQQQQQQQQQNRQPEEVQPQTFSQALSLMGTSPRRIFLSLASSTTIALAANFFGVTSNLLSALPEEVVEQTGLDTYYPRGDYKRVIVRSSSNNLGIGKCSFLIPKEWVADTGLALAQAQRQARVLDYSMSSSGQQQQSVLPDAAYGPPGRLDSRGMSSGDTNVSVIINTDVRNFSLASSLGTDPTSAAEALLSKRKNPTKLISASKEVRGDGNIPVYQFEYTVDRGEKFKPLRSISVVAGTAHGDAFVTLTVVSLDEEWEKRLVDEKLRRVAGSFKLV